MPSVRALTASRITGRSVAGLLPSCLILCSAIAACPQAASAAADALPDVTVTAPRAPTAEQLAGPSIPDFVSHHAAFSMALGQLTRWHTGICPLTRGFSPGFSAFITARIRAIAGSEGHCKANIEIFFTTQPQAALDVIAKAFPALLGVHYRSEMAKVKTVAHPIQGWYVTATRGYQGTLVVDHTWAHGMWSPGDLLDAGTVPACEPGSRLSTGCTSQLVNVFVVADTTKVTGYTVGSIADYVAVTSLSMVQSLDTCDPLPSILDLMSPGCRDQHEPDGITAGDLAFLRALYRADLTLVPQLETGNISAQMMNQLRPGSAK